MSWRKLTCRNGSRVGRIREVDLDERPRDPEQRVAQRDAGVGQPAGIDDRDVEVAPVQPIDERALVVRLEEVDVEPELRGPRRDPGVDLVERFVAVDLGLARADEVEVRALEDEDASSSRGSRSGRPAAPAAARSTTAGSMSSRTTDAVGGREHPAQPARRVLLVGGEMVQDRGERVGERLRRETQRVEQRADAVGALRRRDARPRRRSGSRRAGRRRPPRRGAARRSRAAASTAWPSEWPRLSVSRPPVASRSRSSATTTSTLAQPARSTTSAIDARCEDRRIAPRDRRAVGLEQLEQPLVAERRHLDRLAEGGPHLALGERPQQRRCRSTIAAG